MIDMVSVPKAFLNLEAKCIDATVLLLTQNPSPENIKKANEILSEVAEDLRKLAKGVQND